MLQSILRSRPSILTPAAFLVSFGDASSVVTQMTEPHRTYHNLSHAMDLANRSYDLYLVGRDTDQLWEDMLFYYLAAFYHDIVYVPGSKDNETDSANQFLSQFDKLRSSTNIGIGGVIDDVDACIRLSANHFAPEAFTENTRINRFLDLDLLNLSGDWDDYWFHNQKIRLEYRNVGDADWWNGRAKWIEGALLMPKIFRLAHDRESRARDNLKRELEVLRSKS